MTRERWHLGWCGRGTQLRDIGGSLPKLHNPVSPCMSPGPAKPPLSAGAWVSTSERGLCAVPLRGHMPVQHPSPSWVTDPCCCSQPDVMWLLILALVLRAGARGGAGTRVLRGALQLRFPSGFSTHRGGWRCGASPSCAAPCLRVSTRLLLQALLQGSAVSLQVATQVNCSIIQL